MGNPGAEYEETRHNYGFLLVDQLCRKWNVKLTKTAPAAVFDVFQRRRHEVALVKPLSYMNLSGRPIRELLAHFGAGPKDLVVAYDDLDLPFGTVKMREKGGPGSHNGMASVVEELGTTEFSRIRLGIGPRPEGWSGVDYVLGRFEAVEVPVAKAVLEKTGQGIETLLARGLSFAMNEINRIAPVERDKDPGNTSDSGSQG